MISLRSPAISRAVLIIGVYAISLTGCAVSDAPSTAGDHGGTLVVSTASDADLLFPPLTLSQQGNEIVDLVFDRLAEPGAELSTLGDQGYTGELAERWSWGKDSLSIAFHLKPAARWQDGTPVTARDVRFTYELYTDSTVGSPHAQALANVDSVTVADPRTAVFWFTKRSPEQFYDAAYQMRIVPEHLLRDVKRSELRTSPFVRNPVGSGRFRFVRWVAGSVIEVAADTTSYAGRPHLDRVIWSITQDPSAVATKLFTGEADFVSYLRPADVGELASHESLALRTMPAMSYVYMYFNLRDPKAPSRPHPLFGDRDLRRAITMAVDRERLARNILDSLGSVSYGPFTRAQASADTTIPQIPFDLDGARNLLDSLGWPDANGDGVREKNGRALRFPVLVPSSSSGRIRAAVLIQEMLRKAGVQVDPEQVEYTAFMQRTGARNVDAAIQNFGGDLSPASIYQGWSSKTARQKGGANFGVYASATFDAQLERAMVELDPARAKALYREAYETIIADAPAVWLYEPLTSMGLHRRFRAVGMRPDAWWARLHDWTVPAAERTPRDNIGLRVATR